MSIASEIQALQQDKSDIATAIANKGVTVPSGSGFDSFSTLIDNIDQRKFQASGEFSFTSTTQELIIDNLGFMPKKVAIMRKNGTNNATIGVDSKHRRFLWGTINFDSTRTPDDKLMIGNTLTQTSGGFSYSTISLNNTSETYTVQQNANGFRINLDLVYFFENDTFVWFAIG